MRVVVVPFPFRSSHSSFSLSSRPPSQGREWVAVEVTPPGRWRHAVEGRPVVPRETRRGPSLAPPLPCKAYLDVSVETEVVADLASIG